MKSDTQKILVALMVISSTGALFQFIPFGPIIQKTLFTFCVLLIFAKQRSSIPVIPGDYLYITIILLFIPFSLTSSLLLFNSLYKAAFICQKYVFIFVSFIAAIYFVDFLSYYARNRQIKSLVLFIIYLQLIFMVIKLLVLGKIDEGFLIGSMHNDAGQLGFIFPALSIPLVGFLFSKRRPFYCLFLFLMLILFGICNEKRAIIYLGAPVSIMSFWVFYLKYLRSSRAYVIAIVFSATIFMMIYFGAGQIGSLSGDEVVSTISDENRFSYLLSYAIEYSTMDYGGGLQGDEALASSDSNVQLGRFIVLKRGIETIAERDTLKLFFGDGVGYITPTEYVNSRDIFFDRYGYRGGISSALELCLESGMVGLTYIVVLIGRPWIMLFSSWRNITAKCYKDLSRLWWLLFSGLLIFSFDLLFYSNISFTTLPLPFIFFIIVVGINRIKIYSKNLARRGVVSESAN